MEHFHTDPLSVMKMPATRRKRIYRQKLAALEREAQRAATAPGVRTTRTTRTLR